MPPLAHVDQVRTSLDAGEAEAAQIARAAEAGGLPPVGSRDRAVGELALIAGTEPGQVRADVAARTLAAPAGALPGQALPGCQVALSPPADVPLPPVAVRAGVVDGTALDLAGWGSARSGRVVAVQGGTAARRAAVAGGIAARGGQAAAGAGGALRLEWAPARD